MWLPITKLVLAVVGTGYGPDVMYFPDPNGVTLQITVDDPNPPPA